MPKLLIVMDLRVPFHPDFVSEVCVSLLSGQFAFSSLAVITDMNGRDREGIY